MKNTFLTLLLVLPVMALAQHGKQPVFFLDSTRIDMERVFLNPNSINSLDVVKDDPNIPEGAVYITLRAGMKLLTLEQVLQEHAVAGTDKQLLYMVNDRVIRDKTGILIDGSYITNVEVVNLSDVYYLKDIPGISLVKITTGAARKDNIMIRG